MPTRLRTFLTVISLTIGVVAGGALAGEPPPSPRTIALVGDSTTWGTPPPGEGLQSAFHPAAVLEALLVLETGPWAGARVTNYGVGASMTSHWLAVPPAGCGTYFEAFAAPRAACAASTSWIDVVAAAAPDLVIIDLGINDALETRNPLDTVRRLEALRDRLAPIPVVFFPPMAPPDGPRGRWPWRVRQLMARHHLIAGDYPEFVPTFDRLHPSAGGYAAKAGLWLDAVRAQP